MKVAILTSPNQWFEKYAIDLAKEIKCAIFFDYKNIKGFDIVFILNYHKIIPSEILKNNKHNCVVYANTLPQGKGWSPLLWKFLEGKGGVAITMLEKSDDFNYNYVYMRKVLSLTKYESGEEIRAKQANLIMDMCKECINNYLICNQSLQQKNQHLSNKKQNEDSEYFVEIINSKISPALLVLDKKRYILMVRINKDEFIELVDFVDMTCEEKNMVLSWRNHESIRKWMYNTHVISVDEHLSFINNLFLSSDKQYMLAKKCGKYIGTISITKIDFQNKSCELGIYANPIDKIKGSGSILQKTLIEYVFRVLKFEKLTLEVFSDNERAINLYRRFGFREACRKSIDGKEVVCMEIVNEDR